MQQYKIKLYRSPLFKLIHLAIFIFELIWVVGVVLILCNVSFRDIFYLPAETTDLFMETIIGPMQHGVWLIKDIILTAVDLVWRILVIILIFFSLFCNKIIVENDILKVRFSPRLKKVYKSDISRIEKINSDDYPWYKKLFSYVFGKKHMYKFTCYNKEFVVTSKDDDGMAQLMYEINAMGNKTQEDSPNFDPMAFTLVEKIIVVLVTVFLIYGVIEILELF